MFPSFSVSGLLSDLAADATTIGFDLPGGGYDKLHKLIESRNILPASKRGRMALIAVILLTSRLVKQQLGPLGPVANFLNEVTNDGVREESKRILESVRAPSPTSRGVVDDNALWEMTETDRTQLLSLYATLDEDGRNRLRSHLTRTTAARLASIAKLTPEHLALVLDVLSPRRPAPTHTQSAVSGVITETSDFLFPWVRSRNRNGVRS